MKIALMRCFYLLLVKKNSHYFCVRTIKMAKILAVNSNIILLTPLIFNLFLTFDLTLAQKANSGTYYPPSPDTADLSSLCRQQKQCGLCLQVRGCLWCNDPKYLQDPNGVYDRCNTEAGHGRGGCTQFEPKGQPSSQPLQNAGRFSIEPSGYDVRLWVDQKVNISFRYTDPGNKPLDLYYLMDLSQTMEDDKAAVVELGYTFAQALQSTTTDLKMGFGSFVDKPVMPFASQSHIRNPDRGLRPVYGFENQLPLTLVDRNNPLFENTVRSASISVNLDAPEGGLDAMMQVLECWDEIGWRPNAHRILVVSTDGTFHIAGDGKLGGIVIPNDGQCHLDSKGLYTHSTILDYPSVAQIVAKIREKRIYVIFAVQKEVESLYKTLSSLVSEYAFTIRLDAKSTLVGKLVREQYDKIRSTLELSSKPLLKDSEVGITYFVKCGPREDFIRGSKCSNLGPNAIVEFKAELELKRCPAEYSDKEWTQVLQISPTRSQDSLKVNLHLKCGCGCEEERQGPGRDQICAKRGSVECGICKCNDGFTGDRCQCDRSTFISGGGDGTKCVKPCGGLRGTCKCGQCVCNEPWTGPSCECDSSKCPCLAESRGRCDCQECSCDAGWRTVPGYPPCTCSTNNDGCRREGSQESCSGRGDCSCNRCVNCELGFVGKFCHVCQHCKCLDDLARCAVERVNRTRVRILGRDEVPPEVEGVDCVNLLGSSTIRVTNYENVSALVEKKDQTCFPKYESCNLEYIFNYDEILDEIQIGIRDELDCPVTKPINFLPIIFGTVTSVLVIGILTLLLWKIITYLIDRHEFNKFEKECQGRKWEIGGNPLYKEATSTFQNPAYTD